MMRSGWTRYRGEVLGFVARRLHADRAGMVLASREKAERAVVLTGLPDLTIRVGRRGSAGPSGGAVPVPGADPARRYTDAVTAGSCRPDRRARAYLERGREPGDRPWGVRGSGVGRLVSWEPRMRFRHLLIRSAVTTPLRLQRGMARARRWVRSPTRRSIRTGGLATGRGGDWPGQAGGAELERSEDRARGRGGRVSGAAFLERAAALTRTRIADPADAGRSREPAGGRGGADGAGTAEPGSTTPGGCAYSGEGQAAGGPELVRRRTDARGYVGPARRGTDAPAVRDPPGPQHPAGYVGSGGVLRPAQGRNGRVHVRSPGTRTG